ncbi:hypothetical protein KW800_01590 [Candidatus Parcubacteria bacterium]|nr:hypothetical protein [Candidatus Parcubacteria bacterium]
MSHNVVEDKTGHPDDQHERIICKSEGCKDDCLVRQKWIGDEEWQNKKGKFRLKHPDEDAPAARN